MSRICPYCSSASLVWDDIYGNVVCSSCGAVVCDNLIDDEPAYSREQSHRVSRIRGSPPPQGILEVEPPLDPLASLLNKKALAVLREERVVYEILVEISSHPRVKSRRLRSRIALALYLYLRLQGYSKSRAIAEASRKTGVSQRCLEKLAKMEAEVFKRLERKPLARYIKIL